MPRRKSRGTRRSNSTAHRQAVSDPRNKVLILYLRRNWEKIDPIERGEKLRELTDHGCSSRGLEEELGRSATNILRHMALAALPEHEREALRSGGSAKKALARKAQADRLSKTQERIETDERTGEWSDHLADTILEFCRIAKGKPSWTVSEPDLPHLLDMTQLQLRDLEDFGATAKKLQKALNLKQRLAKTRPQANAEELWLPYQGRWLANLLYAEAPEGKIRERAIEKARQRGKELRINLSPIERYRERRDRLARISASPSSRPCYLGGARRLKRVEPAT